MFIQNIVTKPEKKTDDGNTIRIVLPFKDQIAANAVRRQSRDLSSNIALFINFHQCDLCDADYIRYTARHLHQLIVEHKYSA